MKDASLGILLSMLASLPAWLTLAALSIGPILYASDRDDGVTNASKTAEFRIAWPLQVASKEPEFNGGILKYFRIDWNSHPVRGCTFEMREETPPTSTRFDWKKWLNRKSEDSDTEAHARLSD